MTVTTALYRRYRPDSFADVIGQEHVTEPLMTALRKNRVNHAYLFSGPRGCGKTTSARILARCLNCAQGPTDTPCGTCPSCVELARGGSGSLDVIEIDAASHGGVDDARDLRERATYAPVRDRYKIFIIDEAHMVTSAGFNALLKIVEEPPEHIKFIFATTEPDKVIGTIRSRTHHYPFRLVPPEPLMAYLELLCNQENVPVAPGVLSLVIRAGGGSVRDSLSVLDQLMAGAGPNGLDYELAVALLGYTHASLLDDVVEAVAATDAATVFRAVDRVIQTGHDPRRFVEDLLERFRDLIIVKAMPESAQTILRGVPADQIARLQNQAHNLGSAELSRAADLANTALTEMTGATSPRLQLELLCARILLPSSEQNERGIAARIDRVERRLSYEGNDVGAPAAPGDSAVAGAPRYRSGEAPQASAPQAPAPAPVTAPAPASAPAPKATQEGQPPAPASPQVAPEAGRALLTPPRVSTNDWPVDGPAPARTSTAETGPGHLASGREQPGRPQHAGQEPAAQQPAREAPAPASTPETRAAPAAAQPAQTAPPSPSGPPGDVEVMRRAWPDVLQTLAGIKRSTWALVEPNAQVSAFDGQVLTLAFATPGLAGAFGRADHSENLRQAIHKTTGIDCQINAAAGDAGNAGRASSEPNPKGPASPAAPAGPAVAPTSADVAWGLAPAPVAVPAPAPAGESTPLTSPAGAATAPPSDEPAPAPIKVPAPAASAAPVTPYAQPAPPAPARSQAPQVPAAPVAGTAAPLASAAGDYSYSDDDWGPPRDEDAPPLEEEPPMDWEPTSQQRPQAIPGQPPAVTAEPAPDAEARPSRKAAPGANKPEADPWARAVEQAPGVWVVGEASNVGKQPPSNVPAPEGPAPAPVPPYEPATAQVPPSIPVIPPAAPVREYAMAAAAGAAATSVASAAAKAESRQSLYQRLSNSPEAEAGRAKAPAKAVPATATYVQDVPSADDETIEDSGVFGRAAVERILGGKLIEERSADGSPVTPRY